MGSMNQMDLSKYYQGSSPEMVRMKSSVCNDAKLHRMKIQNSEFVQLDQNILNFQKPNELKLSPKDF